jgi:hypothetical protein
MSINLLNGESLENGRRSRFEQNYENGRRPLPTMDKYEEQEKRIVRILGTKKLDVTRKTLSTYLKYLKNHVEIPCQLTGIEDFEWEECYVFGFGSKKEYEELKKTQPSYKDKFNLIKFVDEIDDYYNRDTGTIGYS